MTASYHYSAATSKQEERTIYNKYMRERASKMRARIAEEKNKPCMDCGNIFPPCAMDFDHVKGKKTYSIATLASSSKSWELIYKEIQKCELVCSNCHRVRTYNRKQFANEKSKRKAE